MFRNKALQASAIVAFLVSCAQGDYTRGIGVYPGNTDDYTGPEVVRCFGDYRNLALGRQARHSSSVDYNLTSQLVTDGIISADKPALVEVETSDGLVSKLLRDVIFDGNDKRPLHIKAEKGAYLTARFYNVSIDCDKVILESNIPPMEVEKIDGHTFTARLSRDLKGTDWQPRLMRFFKDDKEVSVLTSEMFSSCWMPSSSAEEWVSVDLGARSRISRIVLHWLGEVPEGAIEVSDDGETWDYLCDIPCSEIKVKCRGRYVRVHVMSSKGDGPCMLSEMEVYGKGGVKVVPAPQPKACSGMLRLEGGNWKLQRASELSSCGEEISTCGYDDNGWVPATVPGTVASSYFNAGAIPDIRYDDDQLQISESFFLSDFWYRNEFDIPSSFAGKTILLNFDGVNWKADVWVNGQKAGREEGAVWAGGRKQGRIEGAFRRGQFDVTRLIKPGENNSIAVLIHRNQHPGGVKEQTSVTTDFNGGVLGADNPTFHASLGWDWIPTVRGRNIGIWNDVYITTHDAVTLHDLFITTDLPLPSLDYADIHAEVTLKNHSAGPVSGRIRIRFGSELSFAQNVELKAGEAKTLKQMIGRLDFPEIWWPSGYGEQNLYDVEASFETDGGVSDRMTCKSGIREMSYDDTDGSLDMYVNGRRLIGNGGNWGFSEINLNYRAREYDIAVAYHADMGFTLIRNWVGQTGDEEFYEACDRHGVMVWQDFWLANPWDGPDPYYEDMFIDNASDYVLKVRNHPCIALYCGRNEGMPPKRINAALDSIVKNSHHGSHYIPHSADMTVSGFGPYRAIGPDGYFELLPGRKTLHSERGMPNVMTYEGISRMLEKDNHWPQNNVWGMHDFTRESAQYCSTFNGFIETAFGVPSDMKQFSKWAQWVNYDGYRAMYESRSWNRKGLLIWMSHPCWPSMVWQTYDYYFEPTAGYFGAKKGSAPIRIQYNPVTGEVEVVNNNALDQTGLIARAAVLDMYGKTLYEESTVLDSKEDSTIPVCRLSLDYQGLTDVYYIKLSLLKQNEEMASNFYVRGREYYDFKALHGLPKPVLYVDSDFVIKDGEYVCKATLGNEGTVPALMVRLNVVGNKSGEQILPVFYEDNYISLLPGEKRTVDIRFRVEDTRGEKPQLTYELSI